MKLERIEIPFGFVQGDAVYLSPYLGFPARQIGEVKNSIEESTAYFIERFNSFETKTSSNPLMISLSLANSSFMQSSERFNSGLDVLKLSNTYSKCPLKARIGLFKSWVAI